METLYGDGGYQRFWGFRVLAVDGSKIALPDNQAMREAFGTLAWTSGKTAEIQGERPYMLYDVLNRAVSFNAIKNLALDLLPAGGLETDLLLERLTALFLTNPCLERRYRNPSRKKSSSRVLLNFHKRQKKHYF